MAKEAKKDPSELSVEEKLKALYQLQTMLSEIDKIKTLRGELPLEVQDLDHLYEHVLLLFLHHQQLLNYLRTLTLYLLFQYHL